MLGLSSEGGDDGKWRFRKSLTCRLEVFDEGKEEYERRSMSEDDTIFSKCGGRGNEHQLFIS